MTMLTDQFDAVIGVDTHQDTHTAAVVATSTGAVLEELTVGTDPDGYDDLVALADRHHGLRVWAIEGTGSYGAGLTDHLQAAGETVIEIERPNRPARRGGKSDSIDAVRGAREAMGLEHHAQPRRRGARAALAATLAARRSAVDASSDAQRQLRALVLVAPEALRARFRGQSTIVMTATATGLRINTRWDIETTASATALRSLARRINALNDEAAAHEATLRAIVIDWRPDLLELTGVGPIVAATVLCAWSHPGRCRSDAAFASLAGAAPLEASSGKHTAHRLNRGGDRQLNRALHVIAISRLRYDPTTRAYAERRRADDNISDRAIRRCLKRYIARQLYKQLENQPSPT
ncbi:IS110 family transposase [Aquihabitans sp. McL0605]|uniref:IS110 family transposase n=1 Tax=Aquihabitans sp. McL0605 TaxID=3415671 RepID=UPI003CECD13B